MEKNKSKSDFQLVECSKCHKEVVADDSAVSVPSVAV